MIINQLKKIGIREPSKIYYNPSYDQLYKDEINKNLVGFEKAQLTDNGAINVVTGIYTGRSPKDKYIVRDALTERNLWWTSEKKKE